MPGGTLAKSLDSTGDNPRSHTTPPSFHDKLQKLISAIDPAV